MAGKKTVKKRKSSGRAKTKTKRTATTTTKKAKPRTTGTTRRKTASSKKTTGTKKKTTTSTATKKIPSVRETMSKTAIIRTITDSTNVAKKDVVATLECLHEIIAKHVKGSVKFVLPQMLKVEVVKKKARPARDGINPFTGEKIRIKAKPASKAVRIKPLKKLKEMVA